MTRSYPRALQGPHPHARASTTARKPRGTYSEEWRAVPKAWKATLATGRTVRGLWPSNEAALEVAEAAEFPVERIGGAKAWKALSPTQKLDCVATHMLIVERAQLRADGVAIADLKSGYSVLSPSQFWDRMCRELPFTVDAIDALVLNPRVSRVYSHDTAPLPTEEAQRRRRENERVRGVQRRAAAKAKA